jgi:hypothetical protein
MNKAHGKEKERDLSAKPTPWRHLGIVKPKLDL